MMRVLVGFFKSFVNHEGHHTGHDAGVGFLETLTFMMAALHGTAGTAFELLEECQQCPCQS